MIRIIKLMVWVFSPENLSPFDSPSSIVQNVCYAFEFFAAIFIFDPKNRIHFFRMLGGLGQ